MIQGIQYIPMKQGILNNLLNRHIELICRQKVKSKGYKIWNKLPEEIKKLNIRTTYKNTWGAKKALRSKYIESYD